MAQERPRLSIQKSLFATFMICVGLALVRIGMVSGGRLTLIAILGIHIIFACAFIMILSFLEDLLTGRGWKNGLATFALFVLSIFLFGAATMASMFVSGVF